MELSIRPSRSGPPTCSAGGSWLHSRYEPEKEARRFAELELGASKPSHVVLLGPCLDYLSAAVRSLLPGARILSIQYSAFFSSVREGKADASWYPGSETGLDAFLDGALDEDAISGVAVLEWEPASRAFPAEAAAARDAVKGSLDRLASSTATVKASGRRWIANACASYLLVERLLLPEASKRPILVAAAGPSLPESLASLKDIAGAFTLLCVSSALAACRAAGIEPDLAIATDGGFWSRLHLYPLAAKSLPLAAPLTALPSSALYRETAILVLDQGSFAERALLPSLGASLALPPHGTVSGSAIVLASRLTSGPVVALGLDLASYGDLEHARPHGFDRLHDASASRSSPVEGSIWSRASVAAPIPLEPPPWRSSRSLAAYASALSMDSRRHDGRLFRLGPSPARVEGFATPGRAELEAMAEASSPRATMAESRPAPLGEREGWLRGLIEQWRISAQAACRLMGSGDALPDPLVSELLRSIDIADYAASRRALLSGGDPAPAALDLERSCEEFLSGLQRRFFE
jgi:hypothetical protein